MKMNTFLLVASGMDSFKGICDTTVLNSLRTVVD